MRPKLSVVMPHHNDAHGVWFTVQALRLYHPDVIPVTELVVVDQDPGSTHGQAVRGFINGWVADKGDLAGVRYVEAPDPPGSAPAKERAFREASGEVVVCVDCHVFIWPGDLKRLLEYFAADVAIRGKALTPDLVAGVMVYDDLQGGSTHLTRDWRGEQWGTWAEAWLCPCGWVCEPVVVGGSAKLRDTRTGYDYVACPKCSTGLLAGLPNQDLHSMLREVGFTRIVDRPEASPFEIGAHGTGFIACRKEAWPGFANGMRYFGAEEWVIHEKVRKRGGRVLCHPGLRWTHRFLRPDGPRYHLTRFHKVRNFVLGFRDVGMDLKPVHDHFVSLVPRHGQTLAQHLIEEHSRRPDDLRGKTDEQLQAIHREHKIPEKEWELILAGAEDPPAAEQPKCGGCGGKFVPPDSLEAWYQKALASAPDVQEHLPKLRELAGQAESVAVLGGWHHASTVALLSGQPKSLTILDGPVPREMNGFKNLAGRTDVQHKPDATFAADLVFWDPHGKHNADELLAFLTRHETGITRRFVLHDTAAYGEKAEGSDRPGLLPALRHWMRQHSEWSVIHHTQVNNGLTVLSRDQADKPKLPGKIKMAANFAKAVAMHVADGAKKTPLPVLESRLETCSLCEHRTDDRCAVCGCVLSEKASWGSSECPLGLWPETKAEATN